MSLTTVKIPPLQKENYGTWKIHMKALLVKNDAWRYVCGTKPKPVATADNMANITAWEVADEKAMSDIILAISAEELKQINGCNTSEEIWQKLKSLYESEGPTRKAMLLEELIHHKMEESKDMRDHVANFFDTVNKLEAMEIRIPQEMIVVLLLTSLPKSYEPFRVAIKSRQELPTPEELKVKLLDEYQVRRRNKDEKSEAMLAAKSSRNFGNKNYDNRSSGKGGEQRFKFKCHKCNKIGHMSKDCRSRRPESNKKPDGKETSKVAEVAMKIEIATKTEVTMKAASDLENKWCLDSGASSHMCSHEEKFEGTRKTNIHTLNLASSESTSIGGIGPVKMRIGEHFSATLQKTLFVPDLRSNLLSVAKITDSGFDVLFRKEGAMVINRKTGQEIFTAKREEDLYFVKEKAEKANISKDLKSLIHSGKVNGVTINGNEKLQICEICIKGKQTRIPFPKSLSRSTELLELVHTDVCGPMKVESLAGSKYFATFIDDKSRWCEIYFLKKKSELEKFFEFKAKVEKQTGKNIKTLRSDNGGEYRSNELQNYLKKEGICHQLTTEYTPQQNGIAERKNRTLVEMARCMLLQSGLPPSFWAEAILTAAYIRNRCPTRSLDGKTPHEVWTGKIPNAIHFQIFGTGAYMLNKSTERKIAKGKFGERATKCIFVGYSTNFKAYRLWDTESRKICRSRDVRFVKTFEGQQEFKDFMNEEISQHWKRDPISIDRK